MKERLDQLLFKKGLANSRSQAENLIKLGKVRIEGKIITQPGKLVIPTSNLQLLDSNIYVSRAAYKLESVASKLKLNFKDKIVLDVGAAKGGFTDLALQNGAKKVYAVDVGTAQLDKRLKQEVRVVALEKTDIRKLNILPEKIDLALVDVSFISLKDVLPQIESLLKPAGQIVAMVKPQFEAGSLRDKALSKGVVKNDTWRRRILRIIEDWLKQNFKVIDKSDSTVSGAKGNLERFYLLKSKR